MTRMTETELSLLEQAQAIVDQQLATHDSLEKRLFNAALNLIKDEKNWCKGTAHRTRVLRPAIKPNYRQFDRHTYQRGIVQIPMGEPEVVEQYCSLGAMDEATRDFHHEAFDVWKAHDRIELALLKVMGGSVPGYNDSHSHAQVIRKWMQAGHANGWL